MAKKTFGAIAIIVALYVAVLGLTMELEKKSEVPPSMAPVAQSQTLTIWYWDPTLDQAFALFAQQHPGVHLNYVRVPNYQYAQQLRSALTTSEPLPDICMLQDKFAGDFLNLDIWEDLSAPPYGLDLAQFPPDMRPYATARDGRVVAAPYNLAAAGLAYRSQLMKEVFGLTTSEEVDQAFPTWDSLIQRGIQYKKSAKTPFFLFSSLGDVATVLFNQTNQPYVAQDKMVEPQRFLEYFTILHSLYDNGLVDEITQCSNQWYTEFEGGRFLFSPWSMWLNQNKTFSLNEEEDWKLTQPPTGSYKWGGVVCAIPKASQNKALAWEFVRFLTLSPESAQFSKAAENSLFLCSQALNATPEYQSMYLPGFGEFDVGRYYFENLMADSYLRQLSDYDSAIDTAYHTAVKAIAQNPNMTPESSYASFLELVKGALPQVEVPTP